jgi:L-alanine-DL-glutamate epimerase-like enolase superfamily enzyme
MTSAAIVTKVQVEALDLPLIEPFKIATGVFSAANSVLVRLTLADGTVGLGEGSPSLSSGGETAATMLAAAREMAPLVQGSDAARWRPTAELLSTQFYAQSCARAAIEMALLDAWTRHAGIPLWQFFGGAQSSVVTDLTIPLVDPDHARELAAAIAARGFHTIKIKVGIDPAEDEARVLAVHEGASQCAILIDGNQGYTAPGALRLLDRLARHDVVPILFEQPAHRDDWGGMAELTLRSPVPICADEMVRSPADALRVAQEHAAHAINIKLMKSTFLGALDIAAICRAAHLDLMVGAMMESRLGATAAAHFVAGQGGFHHVDLDTPMLIDGDPFVGGYDQAGDVYDLAAVTAGHGVRLREDAQP